MDNSILTTARIEGMRRYILCVRGTHVMLDIHLAVLYGVETRTLVQTVKRNIDRFPEDFMFQLTVKEFANLRSQNVISSTWGGRRYPPYVFTEQGVAMLSSLLRSKQAIKVNIEIMRAFVYTRKLMVVSEEFCHKLEKLENKYDKQFKIVFDAIHQLIIAPKPTKRRIGFYPWEEDIK